MRTRLLRKYKQLSLIQKLSIPLILSFIFGLLLTFVIIKEVRVIDYNTILLKNELIPALEKSTKNQALLKKISENLTFALLAEEEDMISESQDSDIIEKNLQELLYNRHLSLENKDQYLHSFQSYFKIATNYVIKSINMQQLDDEDGTQADLLRQYNQVESYFVELNHHIEKEISSNTDLIEKTAKRVIYFSIIYIIIFSIVLFLTSYLIYTDLNKRLNNLSKNLNKLGIKKASLKNTDSIEILSKNIERTIRDYSIIEAQKKELSFVNKNIQDSIEYASLIQKAILPSDEVLDSYSKENFIFWQQKETVGGDIYFVTELESKNELLIMIIDGVGHGVSGAFLTILVKAINTQIIAKVNSGILSPSPAKILTYFNNAIKTMLKQKRGSSANIGFDGGVLYFNRATNQCAYAGAKTPLYIINDNNLKVIKSDRKNVGFIRTKLDQEYTEHQIEILKETKLYITTDGIIDQEGRENSRYGKSKFENLLLEIHKQPFHQQKKNYQTKLYSVQREA